MARELPAIPSRQAADSCVQLINPTNWLRRKLVHEGVNPDPVSGAILTPIYQSTTYIQGKPQMPA